MNYLIASISCSVAVSVLLKLARKYHIHIGQVIALNYLMAITLCIVLLAPQAQPLLQASTVDYVVIAALGLLLPSVFFIMAQAVAQAGIVLSDAAQRLSLVLPLLAAVLIFAEPMQLSTAGGIVLGIGALLCLSLGGSSRSNHSSTAPTKIGYLLGVWVGYGVIDILFKQLARSGLALGSSLLATFSLAAVVIVVVLLVQRVQWRLMAMGVGLVLGILNFGNIYFYIRAHQHYPENPSLVFVAMNIGVISLGTLVGAGVFKEKLHPVHYLGLALAIAAVITLMPN